MVTDVGLRRVGVTGSRWGITPQQRALALRMLTMLSEQGATELHHGDCVGADIELAVIGHSLGLRIVAHPPADSSRRGLFDSDETWLPAEYLVRNRTIVNVCDFLVACPAEDSEQLRSGTWATIRHARKVRRARLVVGPLGTTIDIQAPDTQREGRRREKL